MSERILKAVRKNHTNNTLKFHPPDLTSKYPSYRIVRKIENNQDFIIAFDQEGLPIIKPNEKAGYYLRREYINL